MSIDKHSALALRDYPITVLLIDDQVMIGEAVRRMLSSESDIIFHFCNDPHQAIPKSTEVAPTVILQDLVMPDIDGLMLLRFFRANPITRDIPMIMLSSKEEPALKAQAFAMGANDYLVKLPHKVELIARIRYHSKAFVNVLQRDEAYQTMQDYLKKLEMERSKTKQLLVELEKINAQLQQGNHELETLNNEKNEFLGIVAHDLKNPLSAIKSMAELMLHLPPNRVQSEDLLHRIVGSSNRMMNLISNLLDINAIERGEIKLNWQPCDLNQLARLACESFGAAVAAKQQILQVLTASEPALVMADPEILTQVLDNLISNAVKYSPHERLIQVQVYTQADRIRCEVRDQGPGLDPGDREKLFNKFTRLSAQPTGGEHSTGLGLSIVKRLVETMEGEVWCESELDQGSTFIIKFARLIETSSLEMDPEEQTRLTSLAS